MLREIPGPVGRLEVLLDEPASATGVNRDGLLETGVAGRPRAAVVLAHPHPQYGGTMHTKAVYQSAKALARVGCAVLRFNFRGVGLSQGAYDEGRGERDDVKAALDFMAARHPEVSLWTAGMSFGAAVGLGVGAVDPRVTTLIGIAIPPKWDLEAIAASGKPKFFIHGERDEICPLHEMREFYAKASEPKELVVIDGANHVFDGQAAEVADAIEELLGDWSE
jgi:alpha/beta superfamily hydrolase